MVRQVSAKQFEKIINGDDLEFRIVGYPVRFKQPVVFEGIKISRDISFENSILNEVVFKNCTFTADFELKNTHCKSILFDSCRLNNVSLLESVIDTLTVKSSKFLKRFSMSDSSVNELKLELNPVFETIDIGCGNNVVSTDIIENGSENTGKDSTIYLCPERFDNIKLKGNSSNTFHVGTVGNHSTFTVEDCKADMLLFSNCNGDQADVHLKDIKPINPDDAAIYLVNSKRMDHLEEKGVFSAFRNIRRYDELTDHLFTSSLT